MTVDIRGTNTVNKGAQLMLEATVDRLAPHFALSAAPIETEFSIRSSLGLRQTLNIYGKPRTARSLGNLVPEKVSKWYGLARDKDLTGVVDASGFAYSDTFGEKRVSRELLLAKRWNTKKVPIVFLPQAYGPFENASIRKHTAQLLDLADLVFVRDAVSAELLSDLHLSKEPVLAPDFTIGLSPSSVPDVPIDKPYVSIVPNSKMFTTGMISLSDYASGLAQFGADARRIHGLEPLVVVHESGDLNFGNSLGESLGAKVYYSESPRRLKSVLGHSTAILSSRFHAVVGGLSQGVPTLAFGWSHKYLEILKDFGVSEWLVKDVASAVDVLDDALNSSSAKSRLNDHRRILLARVDSMWDQVISTLGKHN